MGMTRHDGTCMYDTIAPSPNCRLAPCESLIAFSNTIAVIELRQRMPSRCMRMPYWMRQHERPRVTRKKRTTKLTPVDAASFGGVEAAKDAELRSAMPNLPFDVVDDVAPLEAAVPSGGGGGKSRRTD